MGRDLGRGFLKQIKRQVKSQKPWIAYIIYRNLLVEFMRATKHITLYPDLKEDQNSEQLLAIEKYFKSSSTDDDDIKSIVRALTESLQAKNNFKTILQKCFEKNKNSPTSMFPILMLFIIK